MPVNEPLILINEFKFRMYIHPINKVILYFHGEAVAPWLTPYGGAADMRGWMKQNKCGIGASGSVAFDNAKYATRHSFTVPFTRQPAGLVGLLPPNPVNQRITALPWLTCEI